MPRRTLLALALLVACNSPTPKPAAAGASADSKAKTKALPPTPVERPDPADLKARVQEMQGRLVEARELAAAHAAGTLGDRLATGQLVLVDAKPPADTSKVQYFLLDGAITPPPTSVSDLKSSAAAAPRETLLGGEDSTRPAIFRQITRPGPYTACAVVGPALSAAEKELQDQALTTYRAEHGDKLDPVKLKEILDRTKAEANYVAPPKTPWDDLPLRCKTFEVTADAASRVVVLPD